MVHSKEPLMRREVILNDLPVNHPLRNTPLLNFYHRNKGTKAWKQIGGNYGIRRATYNQLSKEVWQDTTEFMIELEPEMIDVLDHWDEDRMDVIGQNGNEGLHYS